MYKLLATGFPVWPTCSLWGRHPISETGLEHAVAAPRTEANSSIIPQFSGPFIPRPPETTISASAIVTFPVDFSTVSTFTEKSVSFNVDAKSSSDKEVAVSTKPKEFLLIESTFTSVEISVILNALFEKAVLFTWNGEVERGNPTTFEAKPASNPTDTRGARYKLSVVDESTITFAPSFCAACFTTSA